MRIGDLNDGWAVANTLLSLERGAGAHHVGGRPAGGRRQLAPDLVELADRRGLRGDGHVRQLIAQAQIGDYAQEVLAARLMAAMRLGLVSPAAASYIKLARGVLEPLRVAAATEIAGSRSIAWKADESDGASATTNYLNGRIWSIAGGSNQIQRNIISERLLGLPREPGFDTDKPFREVLEAAKRWR